MMKLRGLDRSDKQFLMAAIVAPLAAWWFFTGRNKYGTKGMK